MSGKRRAERPSRERAWVVGLLLLTAVFLGIVATLKITVDRDEQPVSQDTEPRTSTTPTATPSPTPSRTPSPTASTSSASPRPSPTPSLARVEPASPRRLTIGDRVDSGFDAAVTPDDHLIPASAAELARWAERGLPGNPATDTVLVVGSVLADGGGPFGALDEVRRGDEVEITTDTGTLTYTVTSAGGTKVTGQVDDPRLAEKVPGRLVLVGARYDSGGDRLDEDLLVVAKLSRVS